MVSHLRAALCAAAVLAVPGHVLAADSADKIVTSEHAFVLTKLASGLENPWGLDWLPDGRMIVTERPGRIRLVSADGALSEPLTGVPEIVSDFRDGLLDISVSPEFEANSTVYFAYTQKEGDLRWLQIASARLNGTALENVTVIFEADVKVENDQGFGARIRFDKAGDMIVSVGDHSLAAEAQAVSNTLGSIIRIKADGSPVEANPGGDLHPAVYAYGFKNPQGIAIDPDSGAIWAIDHGGTGGDELDIVMPSRNYGWPVRDFGGGDTPGAGQAGDFVEPVFTWGSAPTVALSGLELYTGNDFPNWKGDLFTGSLSQEALIRVLLNEAGSVIGTEYVLDGDIGRVREVRQGPDGRLYVLNDDSEGGIYRIDPAQ